MNIKIIKLPYKTKPREFKEKLKELGFNSIKFSVDRRTRGKHKVIETIRNHDKYKETLMNTLMFEGIISILNRKDFWIGSPDFIIWNDEELYFCEFKSNKDVFRLNQIEWFEKFDMLPKAIALSISGVK